MPADLALVANVFVALAAVAGAASGLSSALHGRRQSRAFQELARSFERTTRGYVREIAAVKGELLTLKRAARGLAPDETAQSEERRRALREPEAEWRRRREVYRGLGWILKNLE